MFSIAAPEASLSIAMHKAWPKLLRRMRSKQGKWDPNEDRNLVIASRTWFCLYLFEHQYVVLPCSFRLTLADIFLANIDCRMVPGVLPCSRTMRVSRTVGPLLDIPLRS